MHGFVKADLSLLEMPAHTKLGIGKYPPMQKHTQGNAHLVKKKKTEYNIYHPLGIKPGDAPSTAQ